MFTFNIYNENELKYLEKIINVTCMIYIFLN